MKLHRTALVVVTTVGLSLGLTGCFNPLEQLAQGGIESIIEQQTGSDIDLSADGNASIPDSFPSEIPVLSGDVYFSQTIEDSWLISEYVNSQQDAEDGYKQLLAAGFTETAALDFGDTRSNSAENDTYAVIYSFAKGEDGRFLVSYTVSTKN
jgi:hypothetical protein